MLFNDFVLVQVCGAQKVEFWKDVRVTFVVSHENFRSQLLKTVLDIYGNLLCCGLHVYYFDLLVRSEVCRETIFHHSLHNYFYSGGK